MMNMAPELLWLALGIVAILVEVLAVAPGIGLLFSGFGALCVALLLYSLPGHDISTLGQLVWFLGFTVAWGVMLWKPLKRWRMPSSKSGTYSNMVGDRAIVINAPLTRATGGQVMWSGAIMNAELAPDSHTDTLPPDTAVEIVAVRGNTLLVKPVTCNS
jgi:membrane protein implicated in regulation of membrane protease activity